MITFVTFHTRISGEDIEQNTPLNQDKFYDYQQTINLMFSSVSKFHSNCKKVILSNLETNLSFLPLDVTVQRYPIDAQAIMLSRLVSQLHFLKSHDFESDVIFLDSDILVNDNLESLFFEEFDLALTIRDDQEMPVNGGVIYITKHSQKAVITFFEKLYLLYTEKYSQQSQWWGDQYALADAIDWQKGSQIELGIREIDGIKILLLPCEIYNFSPNYDSDLDVCELKEQKILHFKGLRKKYMDFYWQNYLSLHGSQDWQQENSRLKQQVLALQKDRLDLKSKIVDIQVKNAESRQIMNDKINSLRAKNESLQKYIEALKYKITEIETSKFWQLRKQYFRLKNLFRKR